MKLIKPLDVTPTLLISSSVPEGDYPAWSASTAYAVGAKVVYERRIYEALSAHTGVNPATDVSDPPKWLDLGAINRWRMFDDSVGSQTKAVGSITATIRPAQVTNALAMFNLYGRSATVVITDPLEGEVYAHEESLIDAGVTDWYEYFFSPIGRRSDFVLEGLPAYGAADITVTVANGDEDVSVGHLVIGTQADIGVALYGTNVSITDYTRKERDPFGNAIIVEKAYTKRAEYDVEIDTARVSTVQRLLASVRAKPVVWIGEGSYEATIIFGFYKDFDISIAGPMVSDATITVEGLT